MIPKMTHGLLNHVGSYLDMSVGVNTQYLAQFTVLPQTVQFVCRIIGIW